MCMMLEMMYFRAELVQLIVSQSDSEIEVQRYGKKKNTLTVDPIMLQVELWMRQRENRPQTTEVGFLKNEPQKPSFQFLNFEVGSVRFLENPCPKFLSDSAHLYMCWRMFIVCVVNSGRWLSDSVAGCGVRNGTTRRRRFSDANLARPTRRRQLDVGTIRRRPNSTQAIRHGTFRRSYGAILVKLTEKEKQWMKYIKIPKCNIQCAAKKSIL